MANLIDQMNVLKGLSDEALQGELARPTGSVPPYLVATEVGRRKDMRQRYQTEQARHAPRTTVVDDLMHGSGLDGAMTPNAGMPGGIAPAAPAATPVQGFADGGLVNALDYNEIASRLNSRLTGLTDDTRTARALALLAAGAGIMGSGHSNPLSSIGAGIDAGLRSYQDSTRNIDSEELALLQSLSGVASAQHQDELQRLQQNSVDRRAADQLALDKERLTFEKTPAALITAREYAKMTPEEKQAFRESQAAMSPYNTLSVDARVANDVDSIYKDELKALTSGANGYLYQSGTPAERAQIEKQATINTYNRVRAVYGVEAAAKYAAQAGLTDADIAAGGSDAAGGEQDPLGILGP